MRRITIDSFFYVASAMFIAVYFFMVYTFSINVPMDDDFLTMQNFLVKFINSEHSGEKISLLLEGGGIGSIHRLLFVRLIVLMVLYCYWGTEL